MDFWLSCCGCGFWFQSGNNVGETLDTVEITLLWCLLTFGSSASPEVLGTFVNETLCFDAFEGFLSFALLFTTISEGFNTGMTLFGVSILCDADWLIAILQTLIGSCDLEAKQAKCNSDEERSSGHSYISLSFLKLLILFYFIWFTKENQ